MSNLMINQLNGGAAITSTTLASGAVIPIQLPATASVPNLTVPMTVTQLASMVGTSGGWGNMALQNATTVAITGGTISGVSATAITNISTASTAAFGTGSADYVTINGGGAGGVIATNAGALNLQPNTGAVNVVGGVNVSTNLSAFNSTVPPPGGSNVAITMSNIGAFGIYFGSSAPTASAAQGSWYMRTDGTSSTSRMYINTTGSTVWASVLTSA